jgi:hypothetical protein
MSKIMVEVSVPAASLVADVAIPYECPLLYVAQLLKSLFDGQADCGFLPSELTMLCLRDTGTPVDLSQSAEDAGLDNSSRLMLL